MMSTLITERDAYVIYFGFMFVGLVVSITISFIKNAFNK